MNELLKKTKCFLLDLDGTIYDDDDVIDGAIDAVNRMRKRGKVVFLTNNSSLSVEDYLARLTRIRPDPRRGRYRRNRYDRVRARPLRRFRSRFCVVYGQFPQRSD